MAKAQASARIPRNIEEQIARYRDENDLEGDSEAVRQLLEAGIEAQQTSGPGERLAETALAISGAVTVGVVIAALGGSAWAWGVVLPFLSTTLIFSLLLASIRVMAGEGLV